MLLLAFSINDSLYALYFAQRIRLACCTVEQFHLSSRLLVIYLVFVYLKHSRVE